jgi:hypothetical protein
MRQPISREGNQLDLPVEVNRHQGARHQIHLVFFKMGQKNFATYYLDALLILNGGQGLVPYDALEFGI